MSKPMIFRPQLLWPLQRFKDSRGQHLLQGEALKFGIDLSGKDFDQDESERVPAEQLPPEVLHSPSDPEYHEPSKSGPEADVPHVPPHMPHARWETGAAASTTAVPSLPNDGFVYRWMLGEWSQCSQECGAAGSGLQVSEMGAVAVRTVKYPALEYQYKNKKMRNGHTLFLHYAATFFGDGQNCALSAGVR